MNAPYETRLHRAAEWADQDRIARQEELQYADLAQSFTDEDWAKHDALIGALWKRGQDLRRQKKEADAVMWKLVDDLVSMLDACRDRELDKADPDDVLAAYDRHLAETAAYWDTP